MHFNCLNVIVGAILTLFHFDMYLTFLMDEVQEEAYEILESHALVHQPV